MKDVYVKYIFKLHFYKITYLLIMEIKNINLPSFKEVFEKRAMFKKYDLFLYVPINQLIEVKNSVKIVKEVKFKYEKRTDSTIYIDEEGGIFKKEEMLLVNEFGDNDIKLLVSSLNDQRKQFVDNHHTKHWQWLKE